MAESFQREVPRYVSPFIKQWPDRCVLCARCVHACKEIKGVGCIQIVDNGFHSYIGPVPGVECISCGECLSVCPVGALTDDVLDPQGPHLAVQEGADHLRVLRGGLPTGPQRQERPLLRVTTTDFDLQPNYGSLCVKGRFGWEFVNHPARLTKPLLRRDDGQLHGDHVGRGPRLRRREAPGDQGRARPRSDLAGFSSARCTNEDNYLFQKFFRAVVGTNNVDHCARL